MCMSVYIKNTYNYVWLVSCISRPPTHVCVLVSRVGKGPHGFPHQLLSSLGEAPHSPLPLSSYIIIQTATCSYSCSFPTLPSFLFIILFPNLRKISHFSSCPQPHHFLLSTFFLCVCLLEMALAMAGKH